MVSLGNAWDGILADEFQKEYYLRLRQFLKMEYSSRRIFPDMYDIFNALILEVPFTSLFDVVKIHTTYKGINILPLDLLVKDKYNSTDLITKIKTRLLIMTTESDALIPYTQALNLYEQAPEPKQIKIYKGAAHDTLYNLANKS